MALQIRRGTESDRTSNGSFNSFLPAQGELVYTTDQKELWVGDGSTYGGIRVAPVRSVNGLTGTVALTSDNITQGSTNKYYSSSQAQQDAATALINGTSTGITFSYNSSTHTINAVVANSTALASVQGDANPALGGTLSLNSFGINGTGTINITGNITATTYQGAIKTDSITPLTATVFYGGTSAPLTVRGISAGNANVNLEVAASNGTSASPTNTAAGNLLGGFKTTGYYGGGFKTAVQISTQWASDADLTTTFPKSTIVFATGNNTASQVTASATLDGNGTFTPRILQVQSYPSTAYPAGGSITTLGTVVITGTAGQFSCSATTLSVGGTVTITGTLGGTGSISGYTTGTTYYIIATNGSTTFTLSTTTNGSGVTTTAGTPTGLTYSALLPQKGMIIFDSTTNHFVGYNGTAWVQFTGP